MIKLLVKSDRHPSQSRTGLLAALALLSLITLSCASRHAPSLSDRAQRYYPVRIATGVQARPGGVAWSPDGKTLAYINGKVNLYDINTTERRTLTINAPHFLCWSADGRLLVLYQEQGRDALLSADRKGENPTNMDVDEGAEATYFAPNTGDILVVAARFTPFSFGTGMGLRLSSRGLNGRSKKDLYALDKAYPWKQLDLPRLLAWTHAGLNPVDNSLLVIEYAKPPAFPPLSRVVSVDPVSGEKREIFNNVQRMVYTSASWSPDGRSLALTDGDGLLRIRTAQGHWITPDTSSPGFFPSWNPKGAMVYSGGFVIDLERKNSEALLTQGAWSIAQWSPDGSRLAVAVDGDLWLFSGFLPTASPDVEGSGSLAKKMSLLQNLFREGLITPEEYKERRNNLMIKW